MNYEWTFTLQLQTWQQGPRTNWLSGLTLPLETVPPPCRTTTLLVTNRRGLSSRPRLSTRLLWTAPGPSVDPPLRYGSSTHVVVASKPFSVEQNKKHWKKLRRRRICFAFACALEKKKTHRYYIFFFLTIAGIHWLLTHFTKWYQTADGSTGQKKRPKLSAVSLTRWLIDMTSISCFSFFWFRRTN